MASIKEAILQLRAKGAVKAVQETNQFTSTLFIVKQVSKDRPIFNLKNLNRFVQSQKFGMEGLEAVRKLIQPGDFMMKLDLQDAYFSVPIHNSHKKYLRFVFQGITYEFQCLPFGLSSAPRTFTKLLKPVIVLLRIQGIRIVIYLDDIAYSGPMPRKTVVDFSECCQSTTTSGISHQTGEMLPSPIPVSRVPGILDQLEGDDTSCTQRQTPKAPNRVQECNPESLADAERTLGFIRQNESLLPSGSSPGTFALSCSAEATYQQHSPEQTSLEQDKGLSERRIPNRPPMVDFDADTSVQQEFNLTTSVRPGHLHRRVQSRMGSTVQRNHDRGTMEHPRIQTTHQHSRNESSPSGHPVFSDDTGKMPQHIGLQMDNSTAVAYVNKRGGTRSSTLAALAVEISNACQQKGIWITAQHLPGVQNVDADWASRHFNERTEWTLDKAIFTRIVTKYYTPQVDLFASRLNHQLPLYVSRHPDPGAMEVDAMTLHWNIWTSFIRQPVYSLPRTGRTRHGIRYYWRCWSTSLLTTDLMVSATIGDVGQHL